MVTDHQQKAVFPVISELLSFMLTPILVAWLLADQPNPAWLWQAFVMPYVFFLALSLYRLSSPNRPLSRLMMFVRYTLPVLVFLVPTITQILGNPLSTPEIAYGAAIAAIFLVQLVPNNLGIRSQPSESSS